MSRAALFCLIFAAVAFCGCVKKNSGLQYGLPLKETIHINLQVEPPTMDFTRCADSTSAFVLANMMEGLTDYDLYDPKLPVVPSLAVKWTPSAGGRIWTFQLRKGVKWTDGVEFRAQHIIDGWERLLNPRSAAEYAYQLYGVKNAQLYNEGKISDFNKVGIRVNDAGDLVVELEKPISYFPMMTTHHSMYPIRKDVIERWGDKWTEPEHIQTLGPYKMKIWDHDKAMVLERFEDYWGEKAKTRYILGEMINEYSTALNMFQAGKLDFQERVPAKEIPVLKRSPGFNNIASLGNYYYGFNTRKPPFNDVRVRHAFNQAVDRKQITDLQAAGHAPLVGWVPRGMEGHFDNMGQKLDVEHARQLLDEAGYKDRSKLGKVVVGFNSDENNQRIAENLQAQLKRNLGVEVQLQAEEWKVFLNRLRTDTPSIYRMGWIADYPDPDTFMTIMLRKSDNNYTGWGSDRYDQLVTDAASEMNHDKRMKMYEEAQKILVESDVPVIPIYSVADQILISERLVGFPVNAINRWVFKGASIK